MPSFRDRWQQLLDTRIDQTREPCDHSMAALALVPCVFHVWPEDRDGNRERCGDRSTEAPAPARETLGELGLSVQLM